MVYLPVSVSHAGLVTRGPFHQEQCDRAIDFARRHTMSGLQTWRLRTIHAEGLLCRGLAGDLWSANLALQDLQQLSGENPRDFFVRVSLAQAFRARYPASTATAKLFDELAATLPDDLVEEAKVHWRRKFLEIRDDVMGKRKEVLRRLRVLVDRMATVNLSDELVFRFTSLGSMLGPKEEGQARALISARITSNPTPLMALAYARLSLGYEGREHVAEALRRVERPLCDAEGRFERRQCRIVRKWLQRMEIDDDQTHLADAADATGVAAKKGRRISCCDEP